jgi:flagellar hook-associated protein 1 FlgK
MAGLFNTLNLGARSMQAQQLGIEVTGQNLSNVNNTAYSRQRVVVQTAYARQSEVGPIGTGVQAVAIRQIRDAVYDRQFESETSITSYLETQQKALGFLQTYLGEQVIIKGVMIPTGRFHQVDSLPHYRVYLILSTSRFKSIFFI